MTYLEEDDMYHDMFQKFLLRVLSSFPPAETNQSTYSNERANVYARWR